MEPIIKFHTLIGLVRIKTLCAPWPVTFIFCCLQNDVYFTLVQLCAVRAICCYTYNTEHAGDVDLCNHKQRTMISPALVLWKTLLNAQMVMVTMMTEEVTTTLPT